MTAYCIKCFAKIPKQGVPHRVKAKTGAWCGGIEPAPMPRTTERKPANARAKSIKPAPKPKKPVLVRSIVNGGAPGLGKR